MELQKNFFYLKPALSRDVMGPSSNLFRFQRGTSLIFRSPFEMNVSRFYALSRLQNQSRDPAETLALSLQQKIQQQIRFKMASFNPQFIQIARDVERVNADDFLSTEDKQKQINSIREKYGVSKDDMKHFVTEPLEKIYAEAKQGLEQEIDLLKKDKERIESFYGKDSPQALQAARTLDRVMSIIEPLHQKLQQSQETYHGMYQKGGCLKKVASGFGNIFKGVAKTLLNGVKGIVNPQNWFKPGFWLNIIAPIALNFIPGVGTIAAVALKWGKIASTAFQTIKSLAQKNWQAALSGVMGIATQISGNFSAKVNEVIQKGREWVQGNIFSILK